MSGSGRGPDSSARNTHAFETARLTVDLPVVADADRLFELAGGADGREVTATLVWDGPADRSEIERWIDRCRTAPYAEFGFHWVIRDRTGEFDEPGAALGAIGTRPLGEPGHADVGYWLGRQFWGRGVMTEALTALLDLGFGPLDDTRIVAEVFTSNERGRALVERVGMTLRRVVSDAHVKRGVPVDFAVYEVDRADWEAARATP